MKLISTFFLSLCLAMGLHAQNSGLQLDGSAGSIVICDSDDFAINEGFTIEAWIYASEWRAEAWQGTILSKDSHPNGGEPSGFAFRAGSNGTLSLAIGVDGNWPEVQTEPFMNADQWYHVAARVGSATLSLFINGELISSASYTGTPNSNDVPLQIGASPGFGGRIWDGVIDEIRVWQTARSDDEIADNQTTEFTGNEPNLVAYFPMNEGSGSTTGNANPAGCNATINSADWVDGYTIAAIDVGVVSVSAPDVLSLYDRPVKVSVEIQNYGSNVATDFPVELSVNGLPTLTETFTGSIQPGEASTFVFTAPLDLRDNNTNLLGASTNHFEDANALNNASNYRYRRPDDGNIVTILNEEQHNFGSAGQTQFTEVNLPINTEDFSQILLHFSVECPAPDCDPWDQPAAFYAINGEEEYELARYITPYRIECGGWTVDVTDFKNVLRGNVTFRSFIQVWGPNGWLVNAELEYVDAETPEFNQVTPLWETNYWVYGEPTVSYDLPAQTNTVATNTQTGHMRTTITGHGQGNTNNAAEFSNQVHMVTINGDDFIDHNLWKADCGQNPCSNQAGNWTPSRAGWCPGQEVTPFVVELTDELTPGQDVTIDYVLEEYTNLLNTDYNDQGHTEPHYRIFSYLVEESDSRFDNHNNLSADEVVFFFDDVIEDNSRLDFLITNTGNEPITGFKASYYIDGELMLEETVDATVASGETYNHTFSSMTGITDDVNQVVYGKVVSIEDENINDDVTADYEIIIVNTIEDASTVGIKIYPNPSNGRITVTAADLQLSYFEVYDIHGRQVQRQTVSSNNFTVDIAQKGLFFLHLVGDEGQIHYAKVVVE